ncbi:septation protein SepH [Dietzia aurantiaca]|uniref:Septation protein SepH n=1 Tax=Dietzia aurantiaca TaxID=983873 RepID=A0ABV9PP54_9ACTN
MRKLRIIGVDTESSLVECEVPDSGEKFSVPLDDRFRAAARGEYVAGGGADRAPVTGTLRPREIQDRIRHGASPEEVAADAGVSLSRIEGFAIPVLLERSNAADLARSAHPVMSDGPSLDTLADKVDAALDQRGIDPELVKWDAWRDRSGGWVVAISWPAGLSDDARATWSFVPDSHGGSARPLDEEAERVLDPSKAAALRTVSARPPLPAGPPPVRSVPSLARVDSDRPSPAVEPPAAPRLSPAGGSPAAVPPAAVTPPDSREERAASERSDSPRPGVSRDDRDHRPAPAAGGPRRDGASDKDREESAADADDFLQHTPTEPERRPSRRHPTMPSWEDVLLGVRSKDD